LITNNFLEKSSEKQTHKTFKQITYEPIPLLADALTTSKIAKILEILDDEQWHTLGEIQQKMKLNKNQVEQIVTFLKKYNFIMVDETNREIKIEEIVRKFLTKKLLHKSL